MARPARSYPHHTHAPRRHRRARRATTQPIGRPNASSQIGNPTSSGLSASPSGSNPGRGSGSGPPLAGSPNAGSFQSHHICLISITGIGQPSRCTCIEYPFTPDARGSVRASNKVCPNARRTVTDSGAGQTCPAGNPAGQPCSAAAVPIRNTERVGGGAMRERIFVTAYGTCTAATTSRVITSHTPRARHSERRINRCVSMGNTPYHKSCPDSSTSRKDGISACAPPRESARSSPCDPSTPARNRWPSLTPPVQSSPRPARRR